MCGGVLVYGVARPLLFSSPFPTPREGGEWVIDDPLPDARLAAPLEEQADGEGRLVIATALGDGDDPPLTFAERWNLRVPQAPFTAPAPDEVQGEASEDAATPPAPEAAPVPRAPPAAAAVPAPLERPARPAVPVPKRAPPPVDRVEQYLWAVYLRKPVKSDSTGDFTWKDEAAAKRLGMTLRAYVIGGMDPDFREQLYHAGHAMDASGLRWSILSAFRDDYRQGLAAGFKAHVGNSLHGGSRATGGYGHGRAIDITCADDGEPDAIWHWLDAHGAKYGLSRPMPRIDPNHVQARGSYHDLARELREARLKLEARLSHGASARTKVALHVDR
ncbi:MAG: hypothetical protein J2P53_12995 [Bradyrhizobiaceae bacterium]|nr:hypothetical protein [Bradyrhizobiaceae bacterium]